MTQTVWGNKLGRPLHVVLVAVLIVGLASVALARNGVSAAPSITATKTDALFIDVNNDNQANPGDTLQYTVAIQNSGGSDATDVQFDDTIDANTTLVAGSLRSTPLARHDTGYSTVGNVQLSVSAGSGVLSNDADVDGTGGLTVVAFDASSVNGGQVNVAADGSFTYNPPPGFEGVDTFSYSAQDVDNNTDPATVSVSVSQVVWFIDNTAGAPGDGRFSTPFNSVANFNTLAADDPGDFIFVYQGSGAYSDAFTLLNNQQLIGHGVGLSVSPNLSISAATRPTIANVTLASGNTLRGLNVSASSGTGVSGASVGALTIDNVSVSNSAGSGVNLSSGVLAVSFDSVSASNSTSGISLSDTSGAFVVSGAGSAGSGGVIQNMSQSGVVVNNTGGALSNFTLNHVDVSNVTDDAVRLSLSNAAQATFTIDGLRVLGPTGNDGVDLLLANTAAGNITVRNSTFQNSGFGFGGVLFQAGDNAGGAWQVLNNTFFNNGGTAIAVGSNGAATPTAVVSGNNIDCPGGTAGGCAVGVGVRVIQEGNGSLQAFVDANIITRPAIGIEARARNGAGRLDVRVRNNSVSNMVGTLFSEGIFIESGASGGTHTNVLCLNIGQGNTPPAGGNSSVGGGGATDGYRISERTGTTFLLQGIANGSSAATVDTFVEANNTGTASVRSATYDGGACTTPVAVQAPQFRVQTDFSDRAAANAATHAGGIKRGLASPAAFGRVAAPALSGETITLDLDTLNAGQSLTLTFNVTIDEPFPNGDSEVANQGALSGSNFADVLTDDPDTGAANDATLTTVVVTATPTDTPTPTATATPTDTPTPTNTPTPATQTFYLHGAGGTANPPTLFLDNTAPTATTAKYKDSASINFNGGNLWKEVGTWPSAPALASGSLLSVSDLHVWLGLKNSDDQGTRFDLRAEVYKNGVLVASSETYCITGVTRNPALALEVSASFGSFSPVVFDGASDVLSLKVLTRIGTNGSGSFCGGHSNAVGLRLYFDALSRQSRFNATFAP